MSGRKLLFAATMAALLLGAAELVAFLFTHTHAKFFRPGPELVAQALDMDAYREFLATRYDGELGWQNPRATSMLVENCLGEPRLYTWNVMGARAAGELLAVDVITVGDSFTHGHEASDGETWPSRLQQITGAVVANYGVNAFDPLQATLQFERVVQRHPEARVAILGVMYENILRIPNAYRGAYRPITQEPFGFKPFVDVSGPQPVVRDNPNQPPAANAEALRTRVEAALESDYWWLPRAAFPHLAGMVLVPATRVIRFHLQRRVFGRTGFVEYHDPALAAGMRAVIERFIASAEARGVAPVVLFMPQNRNDLSSAALLVATLRDERPQALLLDVAEGELDWSRYNLNGSLCHPSAYGYEQIARHVATALLERGLIDEAVRTARAPDQVDGAPPSSLRRATKASISSATPGSIGGAS